MVNREKLAPSVYGASGVAQRVLTESRNLAQSLLSLVDRLAVGADRSEEYLAQPCIIALGTQIVLYPRERFRMRGIPFEDLAVLCCSFSACTSSSQRLRCVELCLDVAAPLHVRHASGGNRFRRHGLTGQRIKLVELCGRLSIAQRAKRLQDLNRMGGLACGLVACGEQPAGVGCHGPGGVDLQIREVPRRDVVFPLERTRVIGIELQRSIVPRVDLEGASRIGEAVLAVVHLGKSDQELGAHGSLLRRDVLT